MSTQRTIPYFVFGCAAVGAGTGIGAIGITSDRPLLILLGVALLVLSVVLIATFVQLRTRPGRGRHGTTRSGGDRHHVRGSVDAGEAQRSGSTGGGFFGGV